MELLIIPFVAALAILLTPNSIVRYLGLVATLVTLGVTVVKAVAYFPSDAFVTIFDPNFTTSFGLTYKMGYDGISLLMVLLVNVVTPLILLSNFNRDLASNRWFTSMVLFMQVGLIGVFTAFDGLMFYIFWEITLIPVFLIAVWFGAAERKKALIKFFLYTFIGSLGMLLSLITLKVYAPSFGFEDLQAVELTSQVAFWVMGGFLLAFAIKTPLFPLHTWQPDTYVVSPMAGTMLLSALMLKMALYGMIRWMIPMAPEALNEWEFPVIVLGLIGVVYAAIIAIKQTDIKRLFAYASISHVGLIAAGIMLFTLDSTVAVFVQIINHSLVAVGLFLAADIFERRLNTREFSQLGGVAAIAPKFAFWFAVIAFASLSVPFTSGFIGEFLLIKGLYNYHWVVGLIAGSTLVFGAVYTLRAYQKSMYGSPATFSFADLTWNEITVFFILTVLIVFLGLYPQIVSDFVTPSLEKLMDINPESQIVVR